MATQPTSYEQMFLSLVNGARAKVGAKALTFDGELNNSADSHSQWMDSTDVFSHTGVSGSNPGARMTSAGYGWSGYGENIAYVSGTLGEATVQQLHTNLMNSPGHYANIVKGSYEEIGIGLHQGTMNGRSVVFVTQNFGTPNSAERAEANDVVSTNPTPTPTTPTPTTPAPTTPTPTTPTTPTTPAGKTINGGSASETIKGTSGNDVINGNGGKDYMFGGAGNDTFTFDTRTEANGDRVADFKHDVDIISLRNIDANSGVSGNQNFTFMGYTNADSKAGQITLHENKTTGYTYVEGDTGYGQEFVIGIKGVGLNLDAGDFLL
jgi:serralysin